MNDNDNVIFHLRGWSNDTHVFRKIGYSYSGTFILTKSIDV